MLLALLLLNLERKSAAQNALNFEGEFGVSALIVCRRTRAGVNLGPRRASERRELLLAGERKSRQEGASVLVSGRLDTDGRDKGRRVLAANLPLAARKRRCPVAHNTRR